MALIYRNTGAWGAGKGARLTSLEADGNFFDLVTRLTSIEDNPPEAISIDYFVVAGTQLYVHMTDHSVIGPYALPVAEWNFRGAWAPATSYVQQDVFTEGGCTYLVAYDHTSAGSFDPNASADGHDLYKLMLTNPDPIADISLFYPDRVRAAGAVLMQTSIARNIKLPANLPESLAYMRVAPATEDISLLIFRNATQIGTLDFSASIAPDVDGGQAGTFTFATDANLNAGDRLMIIEGTGIEDTAALGLSVTLVATVA